MSFRPDVTTALISGALALTGTLISFAVSWAKDFSASAQQTKALEEATKRATFWEAWLKAQVAAADPSDNSAELKHRVRVELCAAADLIERVCRERATASAVFPLPAAFGQQVAPLPASSARAPIPWYRRWLLLYKPVRAVAWLPRIFFYACVAEMIFILFSLLDPSERQDWQYAVIAFVFLIAIFRGLSVWAEKPRRFA